MGILLNKSKNYIINGALDYWQRGTSFAAVGNVYTADRFRNHKLGTMVHTVSKDTDVPTIAQASAVLPASYRMTLVTAQATIAVGDYSFIRHLVEGSVFAPLAGRKLTLSFWVQANLAGQYSVSFRNALQNKSLVRSFTVNAASTWEKKVITIQHDTTGTWDYTTGCGIEVGFTLASGATFLTSTENVWVDGNFLGLTGQVNGVQAGATNFRIAGIQLEEGTTASNFERAGGNVINELQLCYRYYFLGNFLRRRISATLCFEGAELPAPMRVYPSLIAAASSVSDGGTPVLNALSQTLSGHSPTIYFNGSAAATGSGVHSFTLALDAEL